MSLFGAFKILEVVKQEEISTEGASEVFGSVAFMMTLTQLSSCVTSAGPSDANLSNMLCVSPQCPEVEFLLVKPVSFSQQYALFFLQNF